MKTDFMPGITSVSSNALLLSSTVRLLQHVEALPSGATGALTFGEDGVILVEKKRVCWAVAGDMKQRLTDILCDQQEPPIERAQLEQIFIRCKQDGTPLGETLVACGLVTEPELRAALLRHTCEAVIRLAQSRAVTPTNFARHLKESYDPRFVFTTAELLASLAGKRRNQLASEASRRLASSTLPDTSGFAFTRDLRAGRPVIVAVAKGCELAVSAALDIATWATGAFDLAGFVDRDVQIVAGTWCERITLVAWREAELSYAAVCTTRAASALLLSQLAERARLEATGVTPAAAGGKEHR
jgi:hypothetical protein